MYHLSRFVLFPCLLLSLSSSPRPVASSAVEAPVATAAGIGNADALDNDYKSSTRGGTVSGTAMTKEQQGSTATSIWNTVDQMVRKLRFLTTGRASYEVTIQGETFPIECSFVSNNQLQEFVKECGDEAYEVFAYTYPTNTGLHIRSSNTACPPFNLFSLPNDHHKKGWAGQPMQKHIIQIHSAYPDETNSLFTSFGEYEFGDIIQAYRSANVRAPGKPNDDYDFASNNMADFAINMLNKLGVIFTRDDIEELGSFAITAWSHAPEAQKGKGLGQRFVDEGLDGVNDEQKGNPDIYELEIVDLAIESHLEL
jgi:hypothetical protein